MTPDAALQGGEKLRLAGPRRIVSAMDPVAHTLFGATLAETGLRHKSRRAAATLIIGANLPDIDAVVTVLGPDTSLLLRRGWTHGVLALAILPLLLAALMWWWDRRRPPPDGAPPFHLGWIIALAYLSVWSHPTLDWMNTYGVRLLMPFDGRWFYGDTLFIVDPWFWLCTAAGVVLARSSSRRAIAGWTVLGVLASLLVIGFPLVPLWVKIGWSIGVLAIIGLRRGAPQLAPTVARVGFATLVVYIGVVYGLARAAEEGARAGTAPLEVQSNPMPGVPFEHRIVLVYETHYRVVPPHGAPFDVPREEPDEVVRAALAAPSIAGFANWTRFPYWEKARTDDGGWRVTFRDLRYVDPGQPARGIGLAEVLLDQDLRPTR